MPMFNHQPISIEEIGPLLIQPVQAVDGDPDQHQHSDPRRDVPGADRQR